MKFLTALLTLMVVCAPMTASSGDYEQADVYRGLRDQALGLGPQELEPRNGVFALLMETGYDEAAVTIVAAADGSASMYFSNGGGTIGAGEYEQVREVVFETLSETGKYLDELELTNSYPLPKLGQTRFFVVTDAGVLTSAAPEEMLGDEKHDLSPLFLQVHKLIAYIRTAEEHRRSRRSE
ncbi:MAG: hypothetical protein AAFX56_20520 [Pseudomonadota bacterium]